LAITKKIKRKRNKIITSTETTIVEMRNTGLNRGQKIKKREEKDYYFCR
jgi:hypothetical protein